MTTTVPCIAPAQVANQQRSGDCVVLDVRTPAEFREVHASGAQNVPLDQLDDSAIRRIAEQSHGQPIYVICRSGGRGAKACDAFLAAGVANVVNVDGGTMAWEEAGLPVKRGKKTMSLERQVRIAAGSLVFVGSLLTWLAHPYFLALPAFVGAGLVFAGVTDTCGMGMLLAKAPWNQVAGGETPADKCCAA